MEHRKLWISLVIVLVASFAVLGGVGKRVIDHAPPRGRFVVGLVTGHSFDRRAEVREGEPDLHMLPQGD